MQHGGENDTSLPKSLLSLYVGIRRSKSKISEGRNIVKRELHVGIANGTKI